MTTDILYHEHPVYLRSLAFTCVHLRPNGAFRLDTARIQNEPNPISEHLQSHPTSTHERRERRQAPSDTALHGLRDSLIMWT